MHQRYGLIFLLFVLVAITGCDSEKKSQPEVTQPTLSNRIAVTNFPLWCLVSSICHESGGPVGEVVYVGPESGADPHSWMPSKEQIRDLQKVDLIICNGPGAVFANWMDKVTIDENKLCKTTDAISLDDFVVVKDYQLVHSHGPEGEHSHSWVVPQSWLSPRIARKQAKHCYEQLKTTFGASTKLDNGFADLQKQFDTLEAAVEKIREENPGLVVASSTPEIQFLTRELAWNDRYLSWSESREQAQAEKELADMRTRAVKTNPKAADKELLFLWSGRPIESMKQLVETNWDNTAAIDLIATPESEGPARDGYIKRMKANLQKLSEIKIGKAIETE